MNLNLEMHLNRTQAGLYTITYGRVEAPLDVEEAAFAAHGLTTVSPAQLGFLRATQPAGTTTFNQSSRVSADVFYDDRNQGQVVIVPDGAIGKLVRVVNTLDYENQFSEYVLPEGRRDQVYATVDEMLRNGTAFTANHGSTCVIASAFGEHDLTSRLYSDERLGIQAQTYGDWLRSQGINGQSIYFDDREYALSRAGPYLNRLRVHGSDVGFNVGRISWFLRGDRGGAFGVRFEKTAEGCEKNRL